MTSSSTAAGTLSELEHRTQLKRAVIASTIGTTIEWYDFLLYGVVAGLAFGKLCFPKSDPLVGALLAFATYAVGFIARPIGAVIFGHYGDRIGRKATLIAGFLAAATMAIGAAAACAGAALGARHRDERTLVVLFGSRRFW